MSNQGESSHPPNPPGTAAPPPLGPGSGAAETAPLPPPGGSTTRPRTAYLANAVHPRISLHYRPPFAEELMNLGGSAISSFPNRAAFQQRDRTPTISAASLDRSRHDHAMQEARARLLAAIVIDNRPIPPRTPRIPALAPAAAIPALDIARAQPTHPVIPPALSPADQDSPPPASPSPSESHHPLRGGGGGDGAHSPIPTYPTDDADVAEVVARHRSLSELKSFLHGIGIGSPPASPIRSRDGAGPARAAATEDEKAAYRARMAQLRHPAAKYVAELVGSVERTTAADLAGGAQSGDDASSANAASSSAELLGLRGGGSNSRDAPVYYEALESQWTPPARARGGRNAVSAGSGEGSSAQPALHELSGGRVAPVCEGLEVQSEPCFPLVRSDAASAAVSGQADAGVDTGIPPPGGAPNCTPHSDGHPAAPAAAPHFTPTMRGGASSPHALWLEELQERSCVASPRRGPFAPPLHFGCMPPQPVCWNCGAPCRRGPFAPPLRFGYAPLQPQPGCWNCGAPWEKGMVTPGAGSAVPVGEVVVNAFHLSRVDDRQRKAVRDRKAEGEEGEEDDGGGEGEEEARERARIERVRRERDRGRERRVRESEVEQERREGMEMWEEERREDERREREGVRRGGGVGRCVER